MLYIANHSYAAVDCKIFTFPLQFKGYFKTAAPQSADYASLLEDNLLDQALSEPVDVALPKPQEGELSTHCN